MTDVTINESKQKTPDVNARSSQTPEDSRRATQSKNEHYGMATVTITPGTPDFNRFLTARNRSVIRGFNDVSIAISSLFRTVNAVKLKWFTEFGHLNRGDMLTSEQHRCHNEKRNFSAEFKRESAQLVVDQNYTVADAAGDAANLLI